MLKASLFGPEGKEEAGRGPKRVWNPGGAGARPPHLTLSRQRRGERQLTLGQPLRSAPQVGPSRTQVGLGAERGHSLQRLDSGELGERVGNNPKLVHGSRPPHTHTLSPSPSEDAEKQSKRDSTKGSGRQGVRSGLQLETAVTVPGGGPSAWEGAGDTGEACCVPGRVWAVRRPPSGRRPLPQRAREGPESRHILGYRVWNLLYLGQPGVIPERRSESSQTTPECLGRHRSDPRTKRPRLTFQINNRGLAASPPPCGSGGLGRQSRVRGRGSSGGGRGAARAQAGAAGARGAHLRRVAEDTQTKTAAFELHLQGGAPGDGDPAPVVSGKHAAKSAPLVAQVLRAPPGSSGLQSNRHPPPPSASSQTPPRGPAPGLGRARLPALPPPLRPSQPGRSQDSWRASPSNLGAPTCALTAGAARTCLSCQLARASPGPGSPAHSCSHLPS